MAYAIPTVMTRVHGFPMRRLSPSAPGFRPTSPLMSPVKPIYKGIYAHGFLLHPVGAHLVYIFIYR